MILNDAYLMLINNNIDGFSPLLLPELRYQTGDKPYLLYDRVSPHPHLHSKDHSSLSVTFISLSCVLRREKEWTIGENRCDPADYHRNIAKARVKLEALLNVPESSAFFG